MILTTDTVISEGAKYAFANIGRMHANRIGRPGRLSKRRNARYTCAAGTAAGSGASRTGCARAAAGSPPASGESLIREPVAAQSQPVQAIQTKTFGEFTIHLTKTKVVGQILNVEFIAVPPKDANGEYKGVSGGYFPLKDFHYIDETTSKKVTLLQDESGKYMANPLSGVTEDLRLEGHRRSPQALTLKFPAPPATSPTITIDFPKIGSFDSVPVSR